MSTAESDAIRLLQSCMTAKISIVAISSGSGADFDTRAKEKLTNYLSSLHQ